MVYFITGASSFIGVELCRYLTACGHEVVAMSRRNNGQLDDIATGGRLKVVQTNLQDFVQKGSDVSADVFIHLAWAGTTPEERNNPEIHEENVRLAQETVLLAKRMGCNLYVDAGSQAEYGIVQGIITENTPCNPVSEYGKGKLKMFQKSRELTQQLEMRYIHLRIFSVYGENDHENTLVKSTLRKFKAGELVEMRSGGQMWNYLYVKDAARQIAELSLYALEDKDFHSEVYNIASDDTRRLQDFVIVMKEIAGSTSKLMFGGYDRKKDVNLNPDTRKTAEIVKPLTNWKFETVIGNMFQVGKILIKS